MTDLTTPSKPPFWQNALLMVGGIVFALGLIVLGLRLFPDLIRNANPEQRRAAGTTMQIQFRPGDGDLFSAMPGKIRSPENNEPMTDFTITWDSDSFRVPAQQADHYPIAAFGDSFTEGYNVAVPWPDGLAAALGIPVRNYGYRGYGPRETAAAMRDFAGREPRKWDLYGFFAGNELGDITRSAVNEDRSPLAMLGFLAEQSAEQVATQTAANASDHYDYPMPVIIGGNYYDMAFLSYYLFRQLAPPEGFAASRTLQMFSDAIDDMTASTPDTCRALIFIPTKEQLYYPYIYPSVRQYIRDNAYREVLDGSAMLQLIAEPLAEADEPNFILHLTDQRDAIQTLIASKPGWYFVDLTSIFQKHVDAGELLYYPYDSHWNQAGHDLAAATIAEALRAVPECAL